MWVFEEQLSSVVQWSGHRTLNPRTRVRFPVEEFLLQIMITDPFTFCFNFYQKSLWFLAANLWVCSNRKTEIDLALGLCASTCFVFLEARLCTTLFGRTD